MMETPKPREDHAFLNRMIGRWQVSAADMSDGSDWVETVRSLHGIWFLAEGHGRMPTGQEATTLLTLGHNGQTGKYTGSWIGSMMEYLWTYEGELSADGQTLNLYAKGPSFADSNVMQDYREQIIFTDDDNRIFISSSLQPDGSWSEFMRAQYRRLS